MNAGAVPFFEDIVVGQELAPLRKAPITQVQIIQYAAACGDYNVLHVDAIEAREAGYPTPFAHGMLGTAWVAQTVTDWSGPHSFRRMQVRATRLVYPGDALTCYAKVTGKRVVSPENFVDFAVRAVNQDGQETHSGTVTVALPVRPLRPETYPEHVLRRWKLGG